MVSVAVVVVVVSNCWLQGTGAVWQDEQEESLSEQLESNAHILPSNPAVPSYLTQFTVYVLFCLYFAQWFGFNYITDKVGLWQKLSDIDTVIGVTLTGFHFYFLHSELLTIYQV